MGEKSAVCIFCDGGCAITASDEQGRLKVRPADPDFPAICSKASMVDEYRFHPDRLTTPLRRVGERGSGKFEPIGWDEALDEIAAALSQAIATYGPESFAVSEMPLNHGFGGITRRFMNHLGSPNYISPLLLCMGNTFQVHRAVYGGASVSQWENADCIVYFGQNRGPELWPVEYLKLKAAKERGAILIEIDPRTSPTAELADEHLAIRYGTDAALILAWINVILEEDLFDKRFVEEHCIGLDELAQRVSAYTPDDVAPICGINAEAIRRTARLYANAEAAIIPWGATTDMQVNSTSALQGQCILRALCGFLGKSEAVLFPGKGYRTNAEVCDFGAMPEEQWSKQLGADEHPLLTHRASRLYSKKLTEVGVPYTPDILASSHTAVPASVFAAMRGEGPYPVKALFSVANNTLMSYAGQGGIQKALTSLDLLVVFENWLTPTAQLANYVLPGDMWAERSIVGKPFDVAPALIPCNAYRPRVDGCRSWYSVVKGLADRMGMADMFPWEDENAFFDWRLQALGMSFQEALERPGIPCESYRDAGWLTPSGKIELCSSVLKALDCDPLPSFKQPEDPAAESGDYPYLAFAGVRERSNYNTALRQMPELRRKDPEPLLYVNPVDAEREELEDGVWCTVESGYGKVVLMVRCDAAQPQGTVRIPHGWWKPETAPGTENQLSGGSLYNDGLLFPDEEWNLDGPQGVPGLRGSVHVRFAAR